MTGTRAHSPLATMRGTIETNFLSWRSSGDPGELGAVFDACTPKLLGLALHLVGDPADAEDLLQATFLAAIEDADGFQEGRRLLPWLSGILTHRARRFHRRRSRRREQSLDDRVDFVDGRSAIESEGSGELVETVVRRIEQVGDPYRPVLLLSLVHGLQPSEVARVLGRTPGSVRVQLHRGLEQLRQRLPRGVNLPAIAPILIPLRRERGLEAVREAVLAHGVLARTTVVTTGSLGALVMGKKSLAALALVLAAVLGILAPGLWEGTEARPAVPGDSIEVALGLGVLDGGSTSDPVPPSTRTPLDPAAALGVSAEIPHPTGVVLDGVTGKVLANASIEAFPNQVTTLRALKRAHGLALPERLRDGVVVLPLGATPQVREGLRVPWDRPVTASVDPEPEQRPTSSTTTNARGEFKIEGLPFPVTLRVSHPDYESRLVPSDSDAEGRIVLLYPGRRLTAGVAMGDGSSPGDPIRIVFFGVPDEARQEQLPEWQRWDRSGPWIGTAEVPKATFELRMGAPLVYAKCRTPGYILAGYRDLEVIEPAVVQEPRIHLPPEGRRLEFVLERVPTLEVVDAATAVPIEEFGMVVRRKPGDVVLVAGKFTLMDGSMSLRQRTGSSVEGLEGPLKFRVWAEGYRETLVHVEELRPDRPVRIALHRGMGASARVRVVRSGRPVPGAHVALDQAVAGVISSFRHRRIDQATSSIDGHATLNAPAGEYLVRARDGESEVASLLTLGAEGVTPIELDLDTLVHLRLQVRDTDGKVRDGLRTAFDLEDGRVIEFDLDGEGKAEFEGFPPGSHRLVITVASEEGNLSWLANDEVVVLPGETREVLFEVPSARVVFPHLVVEEHDGEFTGWEYRDAWTDGGRWHEVPGDGILPLDVSQGGIVGVREPGGRHWETQVLPNPGTSPAIHLSMSEAGYRGTVEFDPVVVGPEGLEMWARPTAKGDWRTYHAELEEDGSFVIRGLPSGNFEIGFGWSSQLGSQQFYPTEEPSPSSIPLHLRLHTLANGRFQGHPVIAWKGSVIDAVDGAPVSGARIWAQTLLEDDGGTWLLRPGAGMAHSSADGGFRVEVPRGARYRLVVRYEPGGHFPAARSTTVERDGSVIGTSMEGTWEVTLPE